MHETATKSTQYSTNNKCFKISKIGHFGKTVLRQSSQFGAKIQGAKNMQKNTRITLEKTHLKNDVFEKQQNSPFCKGYRNKKNGQFGAKIQSATNVQKTTLESH